MNPNAMVGTAPQRLVQDIMPPAARAVAQPTPTASPPQPTNYVPISPAPTPNQQPTPTESVVSDASAVQAPPAAQPMFPVAVETDKVPVQAAVPASSAQTQTPVLQTAPAQAQTPSAPTKPHFNWLVISLAIIITAGLAVAAYAALKGSS